MTDRLWRVLQFFALLALTLPYVVALAGYYYLLHKAVTRMDFVLGSHYVGMFLSCIGMIGLLFSSRTVLAADSDNKRTLAFAQILLFLFVVAFGQVAQSQRLILNPSVWGPLLAVYLLSVLVGRRARAQVTREEEANKSEQSTETQEKDEADAED